MAGNYLTFGSTVRMVLTVNDITNQKNAQRELEKARRRAEEADRMKTFFLANTSHELRTPLNAIVGFSELLATDPTPEEKQEYLRIIRTNNELLLQLVSDILDLSKIEAGELEYEYSDIELNTIMEEQEHLCRLRQSDDSPTTITFHRKYPSCYLRTDRNRLSQVMANFLSNAVKFTARGSIDFGYDIRGREVYIYVSDTGTGIPGGGYGGSCSNASSRPDRTNRASASGWRSRNRSSRRWAERSAWSPRSGKARPSGSRCPTNPGSNPRHISGT